MPASRSATLVESLLGIRREEYVAVAWSWAYFFCVLSSYYILRPVRESMAVGSGPNTIPLLFLGTFTAMLLATPIFGWVASRYPRRVFLPWVYLFFISNILIFWAVFETAIQNNEDHIWLGRAFFVWISIFNLFVVSVFWSFMADIYTRDQGRRLFGFITAGGSIGALLGGIATQRFVVDIGFQNLFPISAALLLIAVFCITRLRKLITDDGLGEAAKKAAGRESLGGSPFAGMTHVFQSRYFLGIAVASVIASLLGTALYMFMAELVEGAIAGDNERTEFFSLVNNWQNALALISQMFIVKHVVKRWNIGISLTLMPIVSIVGFIILAIEPTLMVVAILTVLRRALGFGFSKPTTDMLYSVVTPEEKYKTKNFIDTAIYRGGDLVGIFIVRLFTALGMGIAAISIIMVPFAAAWTAVVYWLGLDYRRRALELRESGVK